MKRFIFLTIFHFFICASIKAQSPPSDTLAYLQTIVANKAQYIGHPFSNLLSSLQIQVKYFHPRRGIHYDAAKETSTRLAFYFPSDADNLYLTYPSIEIYWQPVLNANESDVLWVNNSGGMWNPSVVTFYQNAVIADIKLRE